ncbi:MAG: hypothetical protein LBQ02_00220 [Candidatus Nomurabacteria bacterium]|jgi:mRNA-degrading endonuclease RelE of RelBE toxin-antitoxin system|nr:hypothetical protein [Candidatus Nomurabacteria bacterium]
MADDTTKPLRKLPLDEKYKVLTVIELILSRNFANLHIRHLAGYKQLYRAKVGRIRIIFKDDGAHAEIVKVALRNEKTYKGL